MDFVDAARASGASTMSIVFTHILINMISPVLVYASTLVSVSILLASGLSFLGLGVSPPTADWGLMLSTLRQVDLRPAGGLRDAGRRDPHHLDRLQSGQRRAAPGDGRQGMSGGSSHDGIPDASAKAARADPRDRGGPAQPMLIVEGAAKIFSDPRRRAQPQSRRGESGRRRFVRRAQGRDAGHRRRIRLRQIHAGAAADASARPRTRAS